MKSPVYIRRCNDYVLYIFGAVTTSFTVLYIFGDVTTTHCIYSVTTTYSTFSEL